MNELKELLSRFNDRLEAQNLQIIQLSARYRALEETFDWLHSEGVDERVSRWQTAKNDANHEIADLRSVHEDIERRIARLEQSLNG